MTGKPDLIGERGSGGGSGDAVNPSRDLGGQEAGAEAYDEKTVQQGLAEQAVRVCTAQDLFRLQFREDRL